jgi:hypothetical protein
VYEFTSLECTEEVMFCLCSGTVKQDRFDRLVVSGEKSYRYEICCSSPIKMSNGDGRWSRARRVWGSIHSFHVLDQGRFASSDHADILERGERDMDAAFVPLRIAKNGRILGCTACGPAAAELANSCEWPPQIAGIWHSPFPRLPVTSSCSVNGH